MNSNTTEPQDVKGYAVKIALGLFGSVLIAVFAAWRENDLEIRELQTQTTVIQDRLNRHDKRLTVLGKALVDALQKTETESHEIFEGLENANLQRLDGTCDARVGFGP